MHELCLFCLLAVLAQLPADGATEADRLFRKGKTWEEFQNGITEQRELWQKTESMVTVPAELIERTSAARLGLQLVVVAEDWCPDSAFTLPYIARLVRSSGVPLRIVDRSIGEPLMTAHRTPDGRTATPTIVLLRDGEDVGAWVERPAELQQMFLSMSTNAENARRFSQRQAWYESDRGLSTLREIVALIERTRAKE